MMMMMMMPASACDTPQPKRKKVAEPTESMRRRLAEHGDPRWPQEQCDSMTQEGEVYRALSDFSLCGTFGFSYAALSDFPMKHF